MKKLLELIETHKDFPKNGIDFKGTPTVVDNGKYIVTRQRNVSKEIENIIFLLNK